MTRGGVEVPVDEALLVILSEILIRRFGENNTLLLPNFREALVGTPKRFALWAALSGDDLVIGIDAQNQETINLDDLHEAEAEIEKEQVH